ncbi:MAG TPA: hypothetical protein PLK30_27590, partial [Blastocatellia bacterium]|nr:hypothetical protein [Blastocatellia bacterium]
MNLSLTMLNAIARNRRTLLTLAVSALFVVALSTMVLRGASASAFDKLGITEQSRVGQIIKRIAPNAKLASV